MRSRVPRLFAVPETYALGIAGWYTLYLYLGIPTLPGWAHLVGAVSYFGLLGGAGWATLRLDGPRTRRAAVRLAASFVVGAIVTSAVTATSGMSVKTFMKTYFVGKVLIGVVGASLFVGVVIGLVTAGRSVVGWTPSVR